MTMWAIDPETQRLVEFESIGVFADDLATIKNFFVNHPTIQQESKMENVQNTLNNAELNKAKDIAQIVHCFIEFNGGLKYTNIAEKWYMLTDAEKDAIHICHANNMTAWMDTNFMMVSKTLYNKEMKEMKEKAEMKEKVAETITSIQEISIARYDSKGAYAEDGGYSGFTIETTEQEIMLLIENEQCCCEDWGYLLSEDNTEMFIGAEIMNIFVTDTEYKNYDIPFGDSLDAGDVVFVNVDTNVGRLQFVAYNAHNGYYGHSVRVVSNQLKLDKSI